MKAKDAGAVGIVQLKIQQAGCRNAALLDGSVEGNTADAEDDTTATCGDGEGPDELWYFATCPGETIAHLNMCGGNTSFDSLLEVRAGACLGAPVQNGCNDDQDPGVVRCSDLEVPLLGSGAGDGLWFALVDGFYGNSRGAYSLSLDVSPTP